MWFPSCEGGWYVPSVAFILKQISSPLFLGEKIVCNFKEYSLKHTCLCVIIFAKIDNKKAITCWKLYLHKRSVCLFCCFENVNQIYNFRWLMELCKLPQVSLLGENLSVFLVWKEDSQLKKVSMQYKWDEYPSCFFFAKMIRTNIKRKQVA